MVWLYTILAVVLVSAISLVGVFTLAIKSKNLSNILHFFVAFSTGALIGDTFMHLLPEAIEKNSSQIWPLALIIGILFFFLLEKILRWRHCHDEACENPKHLGPMNLVGDGFHNIIDGILIGASFLVSPTLGLATTVAVVLHEIPQEMGDFAVLLHSGYNVKKALIYNLLSGLMAIIGAVLILIVGQSVVAITNFMIPLAAGGFLYIALSDLVPELHKETKKSTTALQVVAILFGILIMYGLLFVG
jgi:zinc and cadmium transporter